MKARQARVLTLPRLEGFLITVGPVLIQQIETGIRHATIETATLYPSRTQAEALARHMVNGNGQRGEVLEYSRALDRELGELEFCIGHMVAAIDYQGAITGTDEKRRDQLIQGLKKSQ
jgi:hypothetical protein